MNLYQVAEELGRRLDQHLPAGRERPPARLRRDAEKFQDDPALAGLPGFYEYFHGDNGAGLGASHQTGWTGVVARMMHLFATTLGRPAPGAGQDGGDHPGRRELSGRATLLR